MQIIRSNRKSISIEITKDLSVLVRAPLRMSDKKIAEFVELKSDWIDKHIELVRERNEKNADVVKFTDVEIKELAQKAKEYIPERVAYYAQIMNVSYVRITIRNQVSRWGSCSTKGNLNFTGLLMLTPPEVIDYVVVHELCHLKEMNHSKKFWAEMEKMIPNYKEQKKWLKDNGSEIIGRLRDG